MYLFEYLFFVLLTKKSKKKNCPHIGHALISASRRSPRPFLSGARAPRRFVAGVCVRVSVCISLGGRLTSNYPLAHNDFSSRFQRPRERRPPRIRPGPCDGLYSFASFFSGEMNRVPQRAKLGIELPS